MAFFKILLRYTSFMELANYSVLINATGKRNGHNCTECHVAVMQMHRKPCELLRVIVSKPSYAFPSENYNKIDCKTKSLPDGDSCCSLQNSN
jgi:hypothetical protein